MSIFPTPRSYLEQAKADFRASRVTHDDVRPCHTRYWLQQAYEKAMKAHMLAKLGQEDKEVEQVLRDTILGSHSPLADFRPGEDLGELEKRWTRQVPNHWKRGLKVLKMLRREAYGLLHGQRGANVLAKLDATRQSIRVDLPSYRYPFFQGNEQIIPSRWEGWDDYQGALDDVVSAVGDLLGIVALTVGTSGRRHVDSRPRDK